jgi:hypothetical protein
MAQSSSTPRSSSSSSSSSNRAVNATVDVVDVDVDSDPLTLRKENFETKMKEMHDKDRKGDKLTRKS